MSLYRGWDREAMVEPRSVESESTMSGPSVSSFTPINPTRARVRFVDPQRTLHEIGLIDDTSFLHTIESAPDFQGQRGKKRGVTNAENGRAVSIGRVWEYRDEGDVAAQNQGPDFESSFPKRRKVAPAKRTKTTLRESKNQQEALKLDNPSQVSLTQYHKDEKCSQLTTTSDSSKWGTKEAVPNPRKQKFPTGPFRDPVITKPSLPRQTSHDEKSIMSKPVTIHQGWTSTEEVVKTKFNGISKTTLDKLATFRYNPCTETQAGLPASRSGSLQLADNSVGGAEEAQLASEYGCHSINEPTFNEGDLDGQEHNAEPAKCHVPQSQGAAWTSGQLHEEDEFFSDAIWNVNVRYNGNENAYSASQPTDLPQNVLINDPAICFTSGLTTPLLIAPEAPGAGSEPSQNGFDCDDLSTSEVKEPTEMPAYVDIYYQRSDLMAPALVHPPKSSDLATTKHSPEYGKMLSGSQHNHGGLPDPVQDIQANGVCQLRQQTQTATEPTQSKFSCPTHAVDAQVERSDLDDPQTTPRDVINDFNLDEFDNEGVDDADLLAIASEAAIPETQRIETQSVHRSPVSAPLNVYLHVSSCAIRHTTSVAGDEQVIKDVTPTSPVIFSDDEFPLEEGLDEEDMICLPTHVQGVLETFEAPPSLEYSFANCSMSGEVYDKSLQFSPPKSRPTSVIPGNVEGGSFADGHSPFKVQHVEELGSDPVEKEDWSFIRSNDNMGKSTVPMLSNPMSDQENAIADKMTKHAIPLGPRNLHKRSAYTKLQAVTHSSIIEEVTLDDRHDYLPLQPFARPDFPSLVLDRCPIVGVSAQSFLRVCFRVGEMFREGARCHALKHDAVVEFFARITFSSREPSTTKQHFQLADLWHDRPPFPTGILANYKTSGLAESESRAFIGAEKNLMARCIGRLRRDTNNSTGWSIDIINIRPTDWEEIGWTKRIVSAGLVKSEKGAI
ncbi:hypothetical protein ONS95_011463 [Cadophora gregata]|uniref:uncharacterized protein n=1 Tax=Cadophora gregata TaxID=51156 RepID=UPI0026DD6B5F|nr:uncharacterized protein ONS95_011463 [Cadophora gregata]KAK0120048.1 hypothetical protein ONS95_011463 [Cadophora gregata]KAK0121083.1 hypothetical protein ONS96_011265 [Cadophora gregata f. sp. sojae]